MEGGAKIDNLISGTRTSGFEVQRRLPQLSGSLIPLDTYIFQKLKEYKSDSEAFEMLYDGISGQL